ncbi:MAG: L-lactate dehydrogenase, partial [Pseudomonadota bacterium]
MTSLKPKVAIIGAGNVGATFAFCLMIRGLAREILIIDPNRNRAEGECMDLNHGLSFTHPTKIRSVGYEECEGSDIIVVTAGAKQKEGQTRIDLIKTNLEIFKQIIPEIVKYAIDPLIIVVSNPVDILTYATIKISGLPANKIVGSGTVLDTSRLKYLLSEHCQVDPRNIHAYIIGEHGDTELAVWSSATIGGMAFSKYCPACDKRFDCTPQKTL